MSRAAAPPRRLADRRLEGARREVVDASRAVLARVGPTRLRVEQVAAELGVTKQALYHYFPSKEALLFEVVVEDLLASSQAVHEACLAAPDGPSALEALIRAYVGYFAPRLPAFRLVAMLLPLDLDAPVSPEMLARIRPVNDLLYGAAEAKLAAERPRPLADPRGPRRLAFTAHLAAMGLLTMKAVVEAMDDPLVHRDEDLVDELCRTFRAAAEKARTR